MGDLWAQVPLVPASGWVVLGGLALLIILGKYPTPGRYKELRDDRDHYRGLVDTYLATVMKLGMATEKQDATLEKLITYAEAADHVLAELQAATRAGREDSS